MWKRLVLVTAILPALLAAYGVPEQSDPLVLWYRRPASQWVEALPLGNGRLGGMVYGGVQREQIQLAHGPRIGQW